MASCILYLINIVYIKCVFRSYRANTLSYEGGFSLSWSSYFGGINNDDDEINLIQTPRLWTKSLPTLGVFSSLHFDFAKNI